MFHTLSSLVTFTKQIKYLKRSWAAFQNPFLVLTEIKRHVTPLPPFLFPTPTGGGGGGSAVLSWLGFRLEWRTLRLFLHNSEAQDEPNKSSIKFLTAWLSESAGSFWQHGDAFSNLNAASEMKYITVNVRLLFFVRSVPKCSRGSSMRRYKTTQSRQPPQTPPGGRKMRFVVMWLTANLFGISTTEVPISTD